MKSAISYIRVSSEIQRTDRQSIEIKEYCEKNGIKLVHEFTEKESGKKRKRPELTNMLEYIEKNKVDYCVIHELSRLGRTAEVLHTIDTLVELKVCLISLKESLKTHNSDGSRNATATLVLSVMSSINSFELDTFTSRSKGGLRRNAKTGKSTGSSHIPFGYTIDEDKNIVIDEVESEIVKMIYRLYLNDMGTRKIARFLNDEGVLTKNSKPPTGTKNTDSNIKIKKWTEGVIYQILTNAYYTGKRKYMEEIHSVPVIIDESTQLRVKKQLSSKRNYDTKNKKYDFLLSEKLITCGVCGMHYYARKNKIEHRYQCRSKRTLEGNCGNIGIQIEKLEKAVINVVLSFFPKFLIQKQDNTSIENEIKMFEVIVAGNIKEIDKNEKKQQRLLDLYLSEEIDKAKFNNKRDELRKNISKLINENERLSIKIVELQDLIDRRKNYSEVVKSIKEKGITKERLRKVVSKIVIDKSDEQLAGQKVTNKTVKISVYVDEYHVTFLMTQLTQHIKVLEVFDGKTRIIQKNDRNFISDEHHFIEMMKKQ